MPIMIRRCGGCGGGGGGGGIGYWNPQRGNPEILLPVGNTSFRSGALGAWSAYAQIIAATPAAYVSAAAHLAWVAPQSGTLHIQIATGAGGAEVPIIEWAEGALIDGSGATPICYLTRDLAMLNIATGTRLSWRAWWDSAGGAPPCGLQLAVIDDGAAQLWEPWNDDYPHGDLAVNQTPRVPATPGYIAVAATPAWTTVIAAAARDLLFVGADRWHGATGSGTSIEIGIGAGGAEVLQSRVGFPGAALVLPGIGFQRPARKLKVLAGERVAARAVGGGANNNFGFHFEAI